MSFAKDMDMLRELRRDEGVVPYAYQDSLGYWTIGVGRLIDKRKGGRLTDTEMDYLLGNDIMEKEAELDKALPWWRNMTPARQRVLLNMCFNLGLTKLLGFKNTLKAMESGDYQKAAAGMLDSLWARQVGQRAQRLATMMRNG
ncbi:lysozyme R [Alcaligenes phage vB_Af_QDWS535]|nr:lysozyme R [Alcaligenes phage vB_Af_QDWS535]